MDAFIRWIRANTPDYQDRKRPIKMTIHLLSGFLGSGKTTAIQHACRILIQEGIKIGVITNDQGEKLVDKGFFDSLEIPNSQVINGCFCCNYHELEANIQSLSQSNSTDVIFAESVGSCTDIVATVLKPLLQFHPHTKITLSCLADVRLLQMIVGQGENVFDETVNYIYLKQLEEARVIIINKIDLITPEELTETKQLIHHKYKNKMVLYQNSLNEADVKHWLQTLDRYFTDQPLQPLSIDYDTYAEGEARLAWLDQELEIYSADNNALRQVQHLINEIYKKIKARQYPIGHLKFLIDRSIKISFTSNLQADVAVPVRPSAAAVLLINIRVQTEPEIIEQLIAETIREIELRYGCRVMVSSSLAFKPGYPQPSYRM